MDERYLVLLTKMVIFATVCQLGKFQSWAELMSSDFDHDITGKLISSEEMEALQHIVQRLELTPGTSINRSICDEVLALNSISIECFTTPDSGERHVQSLSMSGVHLTGIIPEIVGNLAFLRNLDLSSNQIHGSIPNNLGALKYLETLNLLENQLTGTIPASLGNLKNLRNLNFENNKLSGEIPSELGNLSQLQYLNLNDNRLSGKLPPQLGNLSNLQFLSLIANNLSGELPNNYKNLKKMQDFRVAGNNLSHKIPTYFEDWVNLISLNLLGNNFEGELPTKIFDLERLEYLLVTGLKNPGIAFPKSVNLKNIYYLILRNCNITGALPSYIANWSHLAYLDLSFNNITGEVPDNFKKLSLNRLFLTGNMMNGTIPTWINKTVQILGDLSYNNFTFDDTELPKDLLYNYSSGTDPAKKTKINIEPRNRLLPQLMNDKHCHGKKSKYQSLFINAGGEQIIIGGNQYEADNSTSNFYVSPSHNWAYSCNGGFFGTATNSIDFIRSITYGVSVLEAPLYNTARLCPQSLTYYGFCLHNRNYTVKLHFSETIFTEDEDYTISGRRVFDVYIQGELVLKDFNTKEMDGYSNKTWTPDFPAKVDDNLLEIKLFWAGKGSIDEPNALQGPLISAISVTRDFEGGLSKIKIVGIVFAGVLALLLLLALMWRMGWLGDRELRVNRVELDGKYYTIKEVKNATRNFSDKNIIGKGRFGIVYKAEFPGLTVAVKKISRQSKQVIDQIRTEIYAHRGSLTDNNIVKLLDLHSKRGLHLLIYEYMQNGSLQQALFDSNSRLELNWPRRVTICLGIAKGLQSMHGRRNPIIHRNIKPSNVLLDQEVNAKVSDLGLAKVYDEENPYEFIKESQTLAYMAPEYIMRKAVTEKIDVFSFGILLLEIVSGKTNVQNRGNEETDTLLEKAFFFQSTGMLYQLVDTNMTGVVMNEAIEILELAMQCVHQSPTLRPTMSDVVSKLHEISIVNTPC